MKKIVLLVLMMLAMMALGKATEQDTGSDEAAVRQVVKEAFIDGLLRKGDLEAVQKGFHKGCEFLDYGYVGVIRQPISYWTRFLKRAPRPLAAEATYKFLSVQVTGEAATAIVKVVTKEQSGSNHISLYKFKNGWKIVGMIMAIDNYKPPLPRKSISVPTQTLETYVGTYTWGGGDMLHVTRDGNRLYFETPAHRPIEMLPETETRFFSNMVKGDIQFIEIKNGKAEKFKFRFFKGKESKEVTAWRFRPKVAVYSGPRMQLAIKRVAQGPFKSEDEALKIQKHLVGEYVLLSTSHYATVSGYFLVDAESLITTEDLREVQRGRDRQGKPAIAIRFKPEAAQRLKRYTAENMGQKMAFILGNAVVTAPRIAGVMSEHVLVAGNFTDKEVADIVMRLKLSIKKK